MKQESGITLIALVITIIVLLILAGVSLAMVAGGNGILTKAGTAAEETPLSDARSNIGVEIADYIAEYYDAKYAHGLGGTETTSVTAASAGAYIATKLQTGTAHKGYYADGVTLHIKANGSDWTLGIELDGSTKGYKATMNTDGSLVGNKWETETAENVKALDAVPGG